MTKSCCQIFVTSHDKIPNIYQTINQQQAKNHATKHYKVIENKQWLQDIQTYTNIANFDAQLQSQTANNPNCQVTVKC